MDNKTIIENLAQIETQFDVNGLTYDGVCIWPYVRNQISQYLIHRSRQAVSLDQSILDRVCNCLKRYKNFFAQALLNKRLSACDVIFLGRSSERDNRVDKKWYNRYCDSFADLFEDQCSVQILDYADDDSRPLPQYRASYHLDLLSWVSRVKIMFHRKDLPIGIEKYSDLEIYLKELNISLPFTSRELTHRVRRIFALKQVFKKIIGQCRPKLFFLVCYYSDVAMAAILACQEMGVPSVEYQHGSQNDCNPYLTHWTRIPDRGYDMLPSYFWNWGESSADRINHWAQKTASHQSFVGGNLWVSKWVNQNFQTDDCSQYSVKEIFPVGYKHILLSLQLWPDHFPKYLSEIIANSPGHWFWHIRQHPRHQIPPKDLNDLFLSVPNIQIEEEFTRRMPLYLLLNHVDLNLTGFSTVAFEAALFQVPTIFFHNNAKDGFKGLIDGQMIFYADNYDDMFQTIEAVLGTARRDRVNSNYINIDPQMHAACLTQMIETTQQSADP